MPSRRDDNRVSETENFIPMDRLACLFIYLLFETTLEINVHLQPVAKQGKISFALELSEKD